MKVSRRLRASRSMAVTSTLATCSHTARACESFRFTAGSSTLSQHSPSLEELDMNTPVRLRLIDISAPVLKALRFYANCSFDNEFTLKFSAPLVDNLYWCYDCQSTSERFGVMWFMRGLTLLTPKSLGHMHGLPDNILLLNIEARVRTLSLIPCCSTIIDFF